MNKIKFNSDEISEKLKNLGVKRSYLSNPNSIYYIGCSAYILNKAFKTSMIDPITLNKIEVLIRYLSDPSLTRPIIVDFVDLQARNDILKERIDSLKKERLEREKELIEIITQVSTDLSRYSEQFLRASAFLNFSIKNQ